MIHCKLFPLSTNMRHLFKYTVLRNFYRIWDVSRNFSCSSRCYEFKQTDLSLPDEEETTSFKNEISQFITRSFQSLNAGQQVHVIQPYIKWGPKKIHNTTPQLQLEEAVSLINTLQDWKVMSSQLVGLHSFDGSNFFGKGKLNEVRETISQNQRITALFISVNMLKRSQHEALEVAFGVPVYDRYLIVMQIFREHAISQEAKIQIALAELPYIYSRMRYTEDSSLERIGNTATRISGTTIHTPRDTRKLILHNYESRLKASLEKLRKNREYFRQKRKNLEHPIVAVVGYTNAGKTSLIKALTGQSKLQPKNHLFATLDVTFHVGILPCSLKVFYVDTVGFISDIPTSLIEPFAITLRDAMQADVIIHVQDISHPDWKKQHDQVFETLEQLQIEKKLLGHVITVGNKVDLLEEQYNSFIPSDAIKVSCANCRGIDDLKLRIQDEVIKATGRNHIVIRAKTGGVEMNWLNVEATVADTVADPKDVNYSLLSVLITENTLEKFKRTFISNVKK